ncbi:NEUROFILAMENT HEAVY POLYPEPTIDE-LIKE [Salix koriyanagi]|uniref:NEUROFILAMENT HEAVY POLYPEPTIDE-LIKE n=1 Tax=Salix koriyanagi TaxID=2511006 RepID=A0A9Q0X4Z5_9ROSI|nr:NEUROFILAMENT HEAVY POLYPEPTIDE-LIKE [Salix koriyanagi]
MDLPTSDLELVRENEKIEDDKERGLTFHCELYDTEIVHKLAQAFLPGLSTACVNNTTGDMFRNPGSVAADIRKEMVDYLTQRSERFVAESVVLEGDLVSDHPYDIISNMVDDFASLKLNLFSRKFNTAEELAEHVVNCGFRTMNCTNEGCSTVFCASHLEKHDSACPFKIIPCEQQCSENVMRRGMDRHCITVCRMKSVSCPFYAVGCQSTMPHFRIQQHCSDNLLSHLLYTLKTIHKGGSEEDLKKRVDQIVESSSGGLADARDARSLILKVKDAEAKLGPLEVKVSEKVSEEPNKDGENSSEEPVRSFPTRVVNNRLRKTKLAVKKSTETINKVGEELSSIQV